METLPITLIVKAPNQQIEDQTIKCELSWTINKLKQHLSEVYPSKPPQHEQKLIYSGQLLNDSVTLKDVLRQYEGQETHTVHLVCTSKQNQFPEKPNQTTTRPTVPAEQLPQTSPNNNPSTATTPPPTTTTTTNGQNFPNMWTNPTFDPNQFARDPNQYAIQLAMMQQAYLQYMTQYMQLAASSYGIPQNVNEQQQQQQQQQQPPQPQPAPIRDPDNPERDWLDMFYMLSRVLILFSVVYFYSSPIRFIFVLLLGFALYLYQIGFFRNINNNNNNNNNVNNNNNIVQGNEDPNAGGQHEEQAQPQQQQEEQAPSRLMVVWTFFTTFFASLIPEIPNAV